MIRQLIRRHWEFVLYVLFGVGTTAVDMGLYALLVDRAGIRWANAWGWCGAVLFAFFTNKYFVFQTGRGGTGAFWREFLEFVAVRLGSLLIQVTGVDLLVRLGMDQTILGVTGALAKVLVTVMVIIINYVFSKFLIFRKQEGIT